MMRSNIRRLIELSLGVCENLVRKGKDGLYRFMDQNDGQEISAHYGATHAAAAFIIWGHETGDAVLYQKGVALLHSILQRWDRNRALPDFHFDFNNFALCLVEGLVDEDTGALIRTTVCNTPDSNHDTINWLPMRWFVNKKRMEWASDNKYEQIISHCRDTIEQASNADGGVEDRLPYGMSFNLQYDVATVAVLQYLRINEEKLDLSKQLGFLLNAVAPDGDINYQGRGTNQIFAWGLWIYLLASSRQDIALGNALDYLSPRLPKMLENGNMMLNEWKGEEKYLWWDYHYASVYTAHCLLWLILAYKDFGKKYISPEYPTTTETGFHVYRSENFFVCWFDGRSKYLAEKGPAIAAIWSKKHGMICKGAFGPWQGVFGKKYLYEDAVLKNFCGLIRITRNKDWSRNKYIHRLLPDLRDEDKLLLQPSFSSISINETDTSLEISWQSNNSEEMIFNIPAYTAKLMCKLFVDEIESPVICTGTIKNQYGWAFLYQTRALKGRIMKLVIAKQ